MKKINYILIFLLLINVVSGTVFIKKPTNITYSNNYYTGKVDYFYNDSDTLYLNDSYFPTFDTEKLRVETIGINTPPNDQYYINIEDNNAKKLYMMHFIAKQNRSLFAPLYFENQQISKVGSPVAYVMYGKVGTDADLSSTQKLSGMYMDIGYSSEQTQGTRNYYGGIYDIKGSSHGIGSTGIQTRTGLDLNFLQQFSFNANPTYTDTGIEITGIDNKHFGTGTATYTGYGLYAKDFNSVYYPNGGYGLYLENSDAYIDGRTILGDYTNNNYVNIDNDGFITYNGTARPIKRLQINIGSVKGAGPNPATYTTYGLNGAFEFSKTITESVSHADAVPYEIDRSEPIQLAIGWSSPATTGNCVWQVEYIYRSVDEDWSSTTPDETVLINATPSTTSDGLVITVINMTTLSDTDEGIITRLSRVGGDTYDTMDDVAYAFGGAIIYYENKLGQKST